MVQFLVGNLGFLKVERNCIDRYVMQEQLPVLLSTWNIYMVVVCYGIVLKFYLLYQYITLFGYILM